MARDLTIPAAIVIGGALVGGGLYFGLSSQQQPAAPAGSATAAGPPAPTSAPPTAATEQTAQQSAPTSPTPGPVTADAQKRTEAEALKALATLKPDWKKKCWDPALKANAEPKTSNYSLNLSFSPEGKLVGVGWSELRDKPSRADVAQCLRQVQVSFTVTPPGGVVSLDVPVDFP